jgi:hypothetical protein
MSRFELLHALRIKGAVEDSALTSRGVADAVPDAVSEGLVVVRVVRGGNYVALSPAGLAAHAEMLRDLSSPEGVKALGAVYDERFLPLNAEFKSFCAEWQQSSTQWDLLGPLLVFHQAILAILEAAELQFAHLGGYALRFTTSHELVLDGDADALVAPIGDSYHNIWFELHEDLLVTLGRNREDEDG